VDSVVVFEETVGVNAVTVEIVALEVDEEISIGVVLGKDPLPQPLYPPLGTPEPPIPSL